MGPPDSPDLTCPFANATVSFCFTKLRVVPNQSFAVLAFGDAQTSLLGKQASRCGVCARRTQGNCPGFLFTELLVSLSTALPGISAFRNADFFLLRSSKRERTLGDPWCRHKRVHEAPTSHQNNQRDPCLTACPYQTGRRTYTTRAKGQKEFSIF